MKTNKQNLKQRILKGILLSAFLLLNFIAISNNGGKNSNPEIKEKSFFHSALFANKKVTVENKKCSFHFFNPFKKSVIPSTYIKIVLKNKKGSFLNIKIGYIS
jgi:hypothetical protein